MRWWAVEGGSELAPAFAAMEREAVPADSLALELWKKCGLRVATVPIEHVRAIEAALDVGSAQEQRWLPRPAAWTELSRSARRPRGLTVSLDRGELRLPPGQPRLLLRGWTRPVRPVADGSAVPRSGMRLELVPQHRQRDASDDLTVASGSSLLDVEAQGLVFRRFTLPIEAAPGMAYLVYPESPDMDWSVIAEYGVDPTADEPPSWFDRRPERSRDTGGAEDDAGDAAIAGASDGDAEGYDPFEGGLEPVMGGPAEASVGNEAGRDAAPFGPVGPLAPRTPSLGETLLGLRPPSETRPGSRVVLVLIPVFNPEYRLLGG